MEHTKKNLAKCFSEIKISQTKILLVCILFLAGKVNAQIDSAWISDTTSTTFTADTSGFIPLPETNSKVPFQFYLGNGIMATLDAIVAGDFGSRLGIYSPVRGINKVGEYYGSPEAAARNGSAMMEGYIGSNGKIYRSARDYEADPKRVWIDPARYGKYTIEEGSGPKLVLL